MRIPFLVPSLLAVSAIGCLAFIIGLSWSSVVYAGFVAVGYVIGMVSIAKAPAGWFRMATSLSHSFVIGSIVGAGLIIIVSEPWNSVLLLEIIYLFPAVAFGVALAIWLLEKGLRLTRFSGRLDGGGTLSRS